MKIQKFSDFINEAHIDELDLLVETYYANDVELKRLQTEFDNSVLALRNNMMGQKKTIMELMESLELKKHETDAIMVKFVKEHKSKSVSYKSLWTKALTKVNGATRAILEALQIELTKEHDVTAQLTVTGKGIENPEEIVEEGLISNFVNMLKTWAIKLKNLCKSYFSAADELEMVARKEGLI